MEELYRILKSKLDEMRMYSKPVVDFTFEEVSEMLQMICLMMQIKKIVEWVE